MTFSSVAVLRSRPFSRARGVVGVAARDRWLENRVWATWMLLTFNVLSFTPGLSIFPLPKTAGKAIAQGALFAALALAITCNKKLAIRPSFFMVLVSLLALECVFTEFTAEFPFGTGYRTVRFLVFAIVMWLLTPFWGRKDMLLVRCHLKTLVGVMILQVVGLFVAPGRSLGNRFAGVIWPIPGMQVAHYSAVLLGMTLILWFCGRISKRSAQILVPASMIVLVLTHTRTALVGAIAGIFVAGLSLIAAMPRVRRSFATVFVVGGTAWLIFSSEITAWMARGESTSGLETLTGRTKFWGPLLAYPRTHLQEIFGFGLNNASFNGLPIDSNWMLSYLQQGFWGITICALILIFLYSSASFAPRGVNRALALFFTTYCLVASFTEDGFTDPTTYLLDVFLAASLLVPFGKIRDSVRGGG